MNKKTHIEFNLNNFLLAMSFMFDKVETSFYQTKANHSKRVAFLSLKIGEKFNLNPEQLFDLCSYALLHNNGLYSANQTLKHNCEVSEENIQNLPFIKYQKDILLYQQEHYDGSGVYRLKKDEIPLFSQIISFSSYMDRQFDLTNESKKNKDEIIKFIKINENKMFSLDMSEIFCDELSHEVSFWLDLQNESLMYQYIYQKVHTFNLTMTYEELLKTTMIFEKIVCIDSKLIKRCEKMLDFYDFEYKDKHTFLISASLINIGKMSISNEITNKATPLNEDEYEQIKNYPYFTELVLSQIMGFKEISTWAGRIQENLDGSGYPYGLGANELSFKDRLMSVLHRYNALRSKKPYRDAHNHHEAMCELKLMARYGKLELSVIDDLNERLKPEATSTSVS